MKRARAATRLNSGFASDSTLPGVVKLIDSRGASCSGSFIANALVLTAAHCVHGTEYGENVYREGITVYPGLRSNNLGQSSAPYGALGVQQVYTYPSYPSGDWGPDWAILVTQRYSDGSYPGQHTGTFNAYSATVAQGMRLFSTGYPSGGAFSQPRFGATYAQYFCDDQWDGTRYAGSEIGRNMVNAVYVSMPCEMTPGASGGPYFGLLDVGGQNAWGIIGVNNRGANTDDKNTRADDATYVGRTMLTSQFDGRFLQWYAAVVADVQARGF